MTKQGPQLLELTKDFLQQKHLVSRKTNAVYDPEFTRALAAIPWADWLAQPAPFRCREAYLARFYDWILSSKLNAVKGLASYPVRHLTNGTTQSFDEFYFKHSEKRLRLWRGEYAYHRRVRPDAVFVEDEPLRSGDCIIVSVPFCSTGGEPPDFHVKLDECASLKIPVLLDCAYFGTCAGLDLAVDHPAIEAVCFSLTKGLGLGDIRSGVRFGKDEDDLPIAQQNRYDHTVLAAARIGLYMMERFSPDFIPGKYRSWQEEMCRRAQVEATPCMHLALGGNQWNDYLIDGIYRRVGIRELLKARRRGEL
jgi:hypothetical protein